MGALSFTIKMGGLKTIQARLKKIEAKLGDRKKANQRALLEVEKWTLENFKTEGGKVGGWQKLSPEYADLKKRMGKEKILHITGWLRMKWRVMTTNSGGAYTSLDTEHKEKKKIKGQTLDYSGGMAYGLAHHEGTMDLPKRQILPTQKQAAPLIKKSYAVWLRKALRP